MEYTLLRVVNFIVGFHLVISYANLDRCQTIVKNSRQFVTTFREMCYIFYNFERYWDDASKYCWQRGGDMLEISDQRVMWHIKDTLNSRELGWRNNGVWTGAYRSDSDHNWYWTTGKSVKYDYFASGQRHRGFGLENCACMRRSEGWRWHDYHCHFLGYKYKFICQFPMLPTTTTTTTTTTTSTSTTTRPPESVSVSFKTDMRGPTFLSSGDRKHSDNLPPENLGLLEVKGQPAFTKYASNAESEDTGYHRGNENDDTSDMTLIGIILSCAAFLFITLTIIFFVFRYRRRKHPRYSDEPPQFSNLSYAQVRANDPLADGSMYLTNNEVNTLYEEVSKQPVNHGLNSYVDPALLYTGPSPATDEEQLQGAVGGVSVTADGDVKEKAKSTDDNNSSNTTVVNPITLPSSKLAPKETNMLKAKPNNETLIPTLVNNQTYDEGDHVTQDDGDSSTLLREHIYEDID